jgi:hypothetical protein
VQPDNKEIDKYTPEDSGPDLSESIEVSRRQNEELSFLFGKETVEQANQVDIVDLNLNKDITDTISKGVNQLKRLKNNPNAQLKLIKEMAPGARIVLCMWIMEMGLLDKIQVRSYLGK